MRTLKFIVSDQIIIKDPRCDFENLVPGTNGYLQAEFVFTEAWDSCVKVATFWSAMGKEYPPVLLMDGKTCMIPAEALKKKIFKVGVIGRGKEDPTMIITTNKIEVIQNGGK